MDGVDAPGGTDLGPALDRHRRELVVHCYRMLGSVHDAEDLAQETLMRAWAARGRYDATRASVRTWLYRIATNACLTALESRPRRPLPSGLGPAGTDPDVALTPDVEVPWLQPIPGRLLELGSDPQARAAQRDSVRLALVAALQLLPARQRAVLLLRDVLEFGSAEVAGQLGTTVAGVNSALQRARATLAAALPAEAGMRAPDDPAVAATVERFVAAFEAADVAAIVALLTDDVVLEMPPVPLWFAGREDYGRFMQRVFRVRGTGWRAVPATANGQPALVAYCPDADGVLRLHTLQVLTVRPDGIARNVVFQDGAVFELFGLRPVLDG
ncbi:RNA polymerase subunit sigma-70 [Kineosporia sp. R_H_3]|uniref:RNA polymerase subunit sigma-70 n=1 Tax=Kineosporia sp. R_H_3 TaxID=1961848 RepID=UPI001E4C7D1A|nr:RNA polymerase subunit sigma-70 [Kineosporia sp. R_H_3]